MYTIGQVSEMFGLPVSTLRYYDKEGLFPGMRRESGIRKFDETAIEALRIIECLKKSGLEIKEIKQFMAWCAEGSETYTLRRDLFLKRKKAVEEEIERMERTLALINYKCWYYAEALKDGNEERLQNMSPEDMPEEIWEAYAKGFRRL